MSRTRRHPTAADAMTAEEANFNFPVLGFSPEREIYLFGDLDALTRCGSRPLKSDLPVGS